MSGVRLGAVHVRLLKLDEVISRLEDLDRESGASTSWRDSWAAERGLQLGTQIVFDVSKQVLGRLGRGAGTCEDIFQQLEQHRVIDRALGEKLEGLDGFRNIFVGDDLRLDPHIVADALGKAPLTFSSFARAIEAWLDKPSR